MQKTLANIHPIQDCWWFMMEKMYTSCGSVPIYSKMQPWYSGEKDNFSDLVILMLHIYVSTSRTELLFNFSAF